MFVNRSISQICNQKLNTDLKRYFNKIKTTDMKYGVERYLVH